MASKLREMKNSSNDTLAQYFRFYFDRGKLEKNNKRRL